MNQQYYAPIPALAQVPEVQGVFLHRPPEGPGGARPHVGQRTVERPGGIGRFVI